MKKLLILLGMLWGGGACGFWYWTDQKSQNVSYRTVTIKRGRSQLHDQRNRNARAGGSRRRRSPGGRIDREFRL